MEVKQESIELFNQFETFLKKGKGRPAGSKNKVQRIKDEVVRTPKQRGRPKGVAKTSNPIGWATVETSNELTLPIGLHNCKLDANVENSSCDVCGIVVGF